MMSLKCDIVLDGMSGFIDPVYVQPNTAPEVQYEIYRVGLRCWNSYVLLKADAS